MDIGFLIYWIAFKLSYPVPEASLWTANTAQAPESLIIEFTIRDSIFSNEQPDVFLCPVQDRIQYPLAFDCTGFYLPSKLIIVTIQVDFLPLLYISPQNFRKAAIGPSCTFLPANTGNGKTAFSTAFF